MKKVSLADVAKSLGVSKTLVSLVLNDKGDNVGISMATQEKVRKAALNMNYKPNQFARGLRIGKSNVIGLIVSDISNPFYARMCKSVEDYLNSKGYNLIICSSDEDPKKESYLADMLIERHVDGLILSSSQEDNKTIKELNKSKFPLVLIDRHSPKLKTNHVVVDNSEGAHKGVEHLVNLGHNKIGYFTVSPSHISTIKDRTDGYKKALKACGVKYNSSLVREIPFENIKEGVAKELKELIMPPYGISALFTVNNNVAVAALEALTEMGIRIPQDLALVSFDDIDAFKLCYPPVTAIRQPIEEMGIKAAQVLLQVIESEDASAEPYEVCLDTELVVRKSCGQFLTEL